MTGASLERSSGSQYASEKGLEVRSSRFPFADLRGRMSGDGCAALRLPGAASSLPDRPGHFRGGSPRGAGGIRREQAAPALGQRTPLWYQEGPGLYVGVAGNLCDATVCASLRAKSPSSVWLVPSAWDKLPRPGHAAGTAWTAWACVGPPK